MDFSNNSFRGNYAGFQQSSMANLAPLPAQAKSISLQTPMIERVHRAKAGCSSCGKKVA